MLGIQKCIVMWFALLAIGTEARSMRRIHRHHHHLGTKTSMGLNVELEGSIGLNDGRRSRHPGLYQDASSSEDSLARGLMEDPSEHLRRVSSSVGNSHAIRKRHNGASEHVAYVRFSDANLARFVNSRHRGMHHRGNPDSPKNELYQVEINAAQNSSLCNYTVKEIPDTSDDQSRTPKTLHNVICNHAGSECRRGTTARPYCCIQTYSKIDVTYANKTSETMKIFTGCVCSLSLIAAMKPISASHRVND